MKADVSKYGLTVTYNPPGFHPITIELSVRGLGVIKEVNGKDFSKLMKEITKAMLEDTEIKYGSSIR